MSGIRIRQPVAKHGHMRSFSEGSSKIEEIVDGLMKEFKLLKKAESTGNAQGKPSLTKNLEDRQTVDKVEALRSRVYELVMQLSGTADLTSQQEVEILSGVVARMERRLAGQSAAEGVSELSLNELSIEEKKHDDSSVASDPTIASLVETHRIWRTKKGIWDLCMRLEGKKAKYFPDCGPFEIKVPEALMYTHFLDKAMESDMHELVEVGTEISVKGPEEGPPGSLFYRLSVWLTVTPDENDITPAAAMALVQVWTRLLTYYRSVLLDDDTDQVHIYFEQHTEDVANASAKAYVTLREDLAFLGKFETASDQVGQPWADSE
ncbi:uncharacterized protein PpBr36_09667 [Pyricularia pennisetigena]|uniref:uncharacterized protein n=1 Tax=Pyricularia pennisetigena TaxID=1578925 RepID=UPI001154546F|nr:uncharacterized protein PpBr36_09667 [Pyricularia pennisetigena]TLS22048.1 hypothetical protein PpBr36_09667 [Pyricularia pennisetigena]